MLTYGWCFFCGSRVISDLFEGNGSNGLILFMPWLRHIIPELSGYNSFRRAFDDNRIWFEENIAEHKKTLQEDNPRLNSIQLHNRMYN